MSANAPAQGSRLVQELSTPIFQSRGWLKFLGVLFILGGIPSIFVLVGIIQIWMGIVLFQAGSSIEAANAAGDKTAFLKSMGNLKTFIVVQGVLALIGLILTAASLCVLFVLPLLGLSFLPSLNNIMPLINNGFNP